MTLRKGDRWYMVTIAVIGLLFILGISGFIFINQPSFGHLPQGERLERIKHSPQYRNSMFVNQHFTTLMTSDKGRFQTMWEFLFSRKKGVRPIEMIPAIYTSLNLLSKGDDLMIWFGHSSYLLQLSEKRILVDPVFCMAAPVSFVNKPFPGSNIYKPQDMPDIDYLIITHDHWDHLDYQTVMQLKSRICKVICPLGVGEHFEYWGFDKKKIIELDWHEDALLENGFIIHCLPARHFSERGLNSNQTLWASFLMESPSQKIYMGGDSGYDTHFKEIGTKYRNIDLAILENEQYNDD